MKKLILLSVFASTSLFAGTTTPGPEIATGADASRIVSKIKDVEVTGMLEATSEFNDCRKMYQYKEGDTSGNDANLKKAEKCFRDKLSSETNKDKLKAMSESLNLQQYGLVPSNNLKDIREYLSDKMYESLTGVNRKEQDQKKLADSLKFGKKKNVDQKVFLDLYKTQLGKNALYEISRYCFENFRLKDSYFTNANPPKPVPSPTTPISFSQYWSGNVMAMTPADVTDTGTPTFYEFDDPNNKDKVLQDIFKNISKDQTGLNKQELENFFITCGQYMVKLCDTYQAGLSGDVSEAGTKTKTTATVSPGAASCLAKNRVQEYKQALVNADKLEQYFKTQLNSDQKASLVLKGYNGEPIKIYGQGDASEPTIDDLTNNTAASTLETYQKDQAAIDKADQCAKSSSLDDCKDFTLDENQIEKTKQKIDLEMTLKRDVEMARVREIVKGNQQDIKQYLEENGYFDMAKQLEAGTLVPSQIEAMIGQVFEAKKQATLAEINNKLGSRQVKKNDTTVANTADIAKDSKEERARLAQVVLFNNIITSHLDLQKQGQTGSAGRNVNALKKETAELGNKVNSAYFQNVKSDASNANGIGRDSQISGFQIIDVILGQDPKKAASTSGSGSGSGSGTN